MHSLAIFVGGNIIKKITTISKYKSMVMITIVAKKGSHYKHREITHKIDKLYCNTVYIWKFQELFSCL